MTKPVKEGRIRQKNKAKILAAAKQEFVELGFDGASIKNIAQRAGLARANIHYYFQDKQDLYQQLLAQILADWNQCFGAFSADADPKTALTEYIKAKVQFSQEDPLASRIFASEIIHGAPHLTEYLQHDFYHWVQSKIAIIEHWVTTKQIKAIDAHHLLFMIWATSQHYADFQLQVCAALKKTQLTDADFNDITQSITHFVLAACGLNKTE